MNIQLTIGRLLYSLAMLGLGVLCLLHQDFIIGRPPQWSNSFTLVSALGYVSGGLIILASLAILTQKKGFEAALTIAALILLLSLSRHLPSINDWANSAKTLALVGGALIVASSFKTSNRNLLVWIGCIGIAVFFIVAGYAHITFYDFVKEMIPVYIPFHGFFAYFTAICLIAGGIGILIPATRMWAALLSGIMVAGWFLLLHIPRFVNAPNDLGEREGLFESLSFAGAFFVLAAISDKRKV